MRQDIGTYDTTNAKQMVLEKIVKIMMVAGVNRIYAKKLSPNDNSKNQPYFGSDLTSLSFIPTGDVKASESSSAKSGGTRAKIKYQASLRLKWIDADQRTYSAPNAKLIYYPQYPEVRFSGFLSGSRVNASRWMAPEKEGRAENRWLLLGIAGNDTVYAYLATPETALSRELRNTQLASKTDIFSEISIQQKGLGVDTTKALLGRLREIHEMGWIAGCKLDKNLEPQAYKAQNGGGYTLEAQLGIAPNGFAEPDFLGWEVKQFGVSKFPDSGAQRTTLMTPEPNGGEYVLGVADFVRRFGYPDRSGKQDRMNFGGKHSVTNICKATGLQLDIDGFDSKTRKITKASGAIVLRNGSGTIAASWSFEKLISHWKRKHSQAVYIPCMRRSRIATRPEYHYGSDIKLGIGTDFEMLLSAVDNGHVYYDPGIKLERASDPSSRPKRRSQFRVNHHDLNTLYRTMRLVDLAA